MPQFTYRARNRDGYIVEGMIDASGEQEAISRLDALECLPISVKPAGGQGFRVPTLNFSRGVPPKALLLFTRQLATMIKAGLPVLTAFTALMEETENAKLKNVIGALRSDIQEGLSLSEALARHPKVFSNLYTSTISAGEAGGVLDRVLQRLAELMEHEAQLQASIKSALRYPIIIIISITIAFFVVTTFVVPAFAGIFAGAGADLPVPTQILIMINHLVRRWWFVVIPAIGAFLILLKLYFKTSFGKYQLDSLKLKLPVLGKLVVKSTAARFAQMFRTLDGAGLPILKSLDEIAYTLGNDVISKDIAHVRRAVQDGRGIGTSILETKNFPKLLGHMVAIGEKTGEMSDMMQSVQEHYDMEVDITVKNLTSLIEPFLILGLGLVVLFIALGIFLPMWDLVSIYID